MWSQGQEGAGPEMLLMALEEVVSPVERKQWQAVPDMDLHYLHINWWFCWWRLWLCCCRDGKELVLPLLWLSHSQREGLAGIRGRAGFSGSVVTVAGGGGCGLLGGSFTGSFFFLCFSSFCQGASPAPPTADSTSS